MRLSTRTRYGTRLLLDMASRYHAGPVHLAEVAARQGISLKYLEQIIIPLKKAKYLESVRGPKGGYRLTRPPAEITVGEIVALLEEGDTFLDCSKRPEACERAGLCLTRDVWREAAQAMFAHLNTITLADLLHKCQPPATLGGEADVFPPRHGTFS